LKFGKAIVQHVLWRPSSVVPYSKDKGVMLDRAALSIRVHGQLLSQLLSKIPRCEHSSGRGQMIKTLDEVLILINPASNPHGPTARHLHGATSRIQLLKSLDSKGWRRYCVAVHSSITIAQ
jgi:hypothetical protein